MLHNSISLPSDFEGDTFFISSTRPPPTTIFWDHGSMRFCFELRRNDPPPPYQPHQSQGWQQIPPHYQHIHPQMMHQQMHQQPMGQFPPQHPQMIPQMNQQQEGPCMQQMMVPVGLAYPVHMPMQIQHYCFYYQQGPPNNNPQMMRAPPLAAPGGQNQDLSSTPTQNGADLQVAYRSGSKTGYAKMASIIISDELEIGKMDTEAIYAAMSRLILGHEELVGAGFVRRVSLVDNKLVIKVNLKSKWCSWVSETDKRTCVRCQTEFPKDTPEGDCQFRKQGKQLSGRQEACASAKEHVHDKMDVCELGRFLPTPKSNGLQDERNQNVLAIDTEKVYTVNGLEVARATLVNINGDTLVDILIKPEGRIIDLNTKFSGIQEGFLEDAIPFVEAREKLFEFVNENTILVGHHLSSDLNSLKIFHTTVVDTAEIFKEGEKYPSLKKLAWSILKKRIHEGTDGHDSAVDAAICMDIIVKKYHMIRRQLHPTRPGCARPRSEQDPVWP